MVPLRICCVHHMIKFKKIWQPVVKRRSLLVGAILIGVVWVTLFYLLKNEHDNAERAAIQNSTNLAGAFEEHLSRSLSEIDRSLKAIRTLTRAIRKISTWRTGWFRTRSREMTSCKLLLLIATAKRNQSASKERHDRLRILEVVTTTRLGWPLRATSSLLASPRSIR